MKKADPATLEAPERGGMLKRFKYPAVSVLIAYEENEVELLKYVKEGRPAAELLKYLERGTKFIPGVDGAVRVVSLSKGTVQ